VTSTRPDEIRELLTGGDRRSIADSNRVRALIERDTSLVNELVVLVTDDDRLVVQRALDLLEKLAHDHPERIAPHKAIFIGALADSDMWEVRLQVVRALPAFRWNANQMKRVTQILRDGITFPQTFVRAWALDSLAKFAMDDPALMPTVRRHLRAFERSSSKALQARARNIRARLTHAAAD
jgi:hypothetical protein